MLLNKKTINYFTIILLFSVVPISLYINFFIFKLTLWSYETKALILYSLFIIITEILILFVTRKLQSKFIIKLNIFNDKYENKFINLTSASFLIGNIFLSIAIYRPIMWYLLPLFQGLIIFLAGVFFINKTFIQKNSLPFFKQFFTIKKSIKKSNNLFKVYLLLTTTILVYVLLNILFQYIIKENYNPLRKSMIYYMSGSKVKVNFK